MYLLIDLSGIRHKGKSRSYKIKIYYLIFKKCENKNKVYILSVASWKREVLAQHKNEE